MPQRLNPRGLMTVEVRSLQPAGTVLIRAADFEGPSLTQVSLLRRESYQ